MLRVRLEIVPGGDERRVREIGKLEICNVSELADVSNYCFQIWTDGRCQTTSIVSNHVRSDGAWALVRKAIGVALKELQVAHQEAPKAAQE